MGSIAGGALSFLLAVVVTRGLHPAGAGVFFEVVALFTILANTCEVGADTGLVRSVSRSLALDREEELRSLVAVAVGPVLVVSSAAAAFLFVLAPQLARVFIGGASQADGVAYIRLLAPFIPLATTMTVALAGTRGFGTMVPFVVVQNLGIPALRPLLVALSIAAGLGSTAIALSWATPLAVGLFAALGLLLWRLRSGAAGPAFDHPGRPLREVASEFWRFAAPRGLAGFFQISVIWLDVLLVGALRSSREAGIYAAAGRYLMLGTIALGATSMAVAPSVSGLIARGDREGAERVFQTATVWLVLVSWPVYMALAVFAPLLIQVFGHGFGSGQHVLVILAVGMLALVGTGNNKVVLLMGGGSGWNLVSAGVALAVNLTLNLLLIPPLGITGAALAWTATLMIDNALVTLLVWKVLRLQPFGPAYPIGGLAAAACFGGLGILFRLVAGASVASFLLYGAAAVGLYAVVLRRFRRVLRIDEIRSAITGARSGPPEAAAS